MVGILTTKKRLVARAQKSEHLSFGFFSRDVRHIIKKRRRRVAAARTHPLFKKKKTCTFATDVGRRLRTTRTSLDVAISSVSVTAARFDAIKAARTRRFFSFFSSAFAFVLSRILCDSFKLTHSLCLNESMTRARTHRRRGHTESAECRRVSNLSKSGARTTREANAARPGRGESSGMRLCCFSSSHDKTKTNIACIKRIQHG